MYTVINDHLIVMVFIILIKSVGCNAFRKYTDRCVGALKIMK